MISDRQKQILQAIIEYTQKNNYPPTIRELCGIVGIKSTSVLHHHMEKLRRAGFITWEPSRPRTIQVNRKEMKEYV